MGIMKATGVRAGIASLGLVIFFGMACSSDSTPTPVPAAPTGAQAAAALTPAPTTQANSTPLPAPNKTPLPATTPLPARILVPTPVPTPITFRPRGTPTPIPSPTVTPTPTPSTPPAMIFSGAANLLTSEFELEDGLVSLSLRHVGPGKFVVELVSDLGGYASIVEIAGNYSGTRAHQVRSNAITGLVPGPYRMRVQADGAWLIKLWNPLWDSEPLPTFDEGYGDQVITSVPLSEGTTTVVLTHDGTGEFVADLLSADGRVSRRLVEVIGEYRGATDLNVHEGASPSLEPALYAMAIQSDGNWTVEFLE